MLDKFSTPLCPFPPDPIEKDISIHLQKIPLTRFRQRHMGFGFTILKVCTLRYSWIAHQLDIWPALACLLSMSDFKSVTSLGLLIKNYTKHVLWIFVKPQSGFVWSVSVF